LNAGGEDVIANRCDNSSVFRSPMSSMSLPPKKSCESQDPAAAGIPLEMFGNMRTASKQRREVTASGVAWREVRGSFDDAPSE